MPKYLGLLLVIISWIIAVVLIAKLRNKDLVTISHHAASTRKAHIIFITVLIGLGLPFYIWIYKWLAPNTINVEVFRYLLVLSFALQAVTALAPDTNGWTRALHRFAAYSMAALYLPLVIMIADSSKLSNFAQGFAAVVAIYMLFTIISISLFKKMKQHYIIFQTLYVVAMQSTILLGVYTK